MSTRLCAIAVLISSAAPLLAAPGEENSSNETAAISESDVSLWVQQLGDADYTVRRRATAALIRAGVDSRPLLQAAVESEDAEIRRRARFALARIDVAFAELQIDRLEAGLSDVELPAWEVYRDRVGADGPARRLFGEMQRAQRKLLVQYDADPEQGAKFLISESARIYQALRRPVAGQRPTIDVGTVAALLFVASDPSAAISSTTAGHVQWTLNQNTIRSALRDEYSAPLRKMLGGFVAKDVGLSPSPAYKNLALAMEYGLREGLTAA